MSFGEKLLNTLGFESDRQKKIRDLEKRIAGLRGVVRNIEDIPQERDDIGKVPSDASLLQRHKANIRKLEDELVRLKAIK